MNERSTAVEKTRDEVLGDGVIVCIRFRRADGVIDACRAAVRGGLRVLEVTLTTPGALDAIATLAGDDGAVVGAGTVLEPDEVRAVADVGGRFALSPVFDPDVVDEAHRLGLLAIPGTATPREILAAHRHGATAVKVFPSGALGGPAYLRAVKGPLPHVPLIPTSGPTAENLAEYVAAGAAAVGVGGELFPEGYTSETVEVAARRVRAAMDRARGSASSATETGA